VTLPGAISRKPAVRTEFSARYLQLAFSITSITSGWMALKFKRLFSTRPLRRREISQRAEDYGDPRGLKCADSVSRVLNGVGPFNGLGKLLNLDDRILAVTPSQIAYAFLVRKGSLRISAISMSILAILGCGISIVAYAFTSIVLDKFGLTGLHISIAHSGLPNYIMNLLFVSLFSYCWLQLPVAVVLQAYLRQRAAERRSVVKQRPEGR
jgi:hypothetical protein